MYVTTEFMPPSSLFISQPALLSFLSYIQCNTDRRLFFLLRTSFSVEMLYSRIEYVSLSFSNNMNPRIPDTANTKRVGFHVDTLCYSSVDKHASLIKIELSLDRFSQILRGLSWVTACGVSTESCYGAGNNLARQVPVPLTGLDHNATLAVTIGGDGYGHGSARE